MNFNISAVTESLGSGRALPIGLRRSISLLAAGLAAVALLAAATNSEALVINPTFDSSITSNPNAVAIEAGINAMIARVESTISNPITVNILYQSMNTGLGQSTTFINFLPYSQYRNDLLTNQTLSANDTTALATLPAGSANPVNGTSSVFLTMPLLRAIGESALGVAPGGIDSTIGLNTSIMNLSRTGPQNPGFYDLQTVAAHETNEVLGIGGPGTDLPSTTGAVGALDLFRYASPGVRSFTASTSASSYFSINGGVTNLSNFNQSGGGADYADWATSTLHQVQDAFGTPGAQLDNGPAEKTAFDVVGYNLITAQTPEPASFVLFGLGAVALAAVTRRRHKA